MVQNTIEAPNMPPEGYDQKKSYARFMAEMAAYEADHQRNMMRARRIALWGNAFIILFTIGWCVAPYLLALWRRP